jgi:hypothetical protein
MTGDKKKLEDVVDDHPLFHTHRWDYMLQSDSYYFTGATRSHLEICNLLKTPSYFLTIRCNLKNYDDEIGKFLSWIAPYIHTNEDFEFLGYMRYETESEPTLIYYNKITKSISFRYLEEE